MRGLIQPRTIPPYSQEHTSSRFAAQAASSATVSAICSVSPGVLRTVLMTGKTSGDSSKRVPHDIFGGIHESFTTQGPRAGLD